MKLLPAVSLSVLLCAGMASAQLHGTYTIKADSSGDFRTTSEACHALCHTGISGECIFEIYGDTVVIDDFTLDQVPGSDSWTITFRPGSGERPVLVGPAIACYVDNLKLESLEFFGACGFFYGSRLRISNCRISALFDRSGIYLDHGSFDSIIGNVISADYANNVIYSHTGRDNVIANNFVYGVLYEWANSEGLVEVNDGERGLKFYHNSLCYFDTTCVDRTSLLLNDWGQADVRNNVFMLAMPSDTTNGCVAYYGNNSRDSLILDYNCYYIELLGHIGLSNGYPAPTRYHWNEWQGLGFEPHGIYSDPLVVGPQDLHLRPGSHCIGTGTTIPGFTTDIDGDARDPVHPCIGADEYTGGAVTEHPITSTPSRIAGTTVMRGVLIMPMSTSNKSQVTSQLLDITGRKVLDLHAGANDIRNLTPGVYYIKNDCYRLISKRIILK